MTKLDVTYPDAERLTVDLLKTKLAADEPAVTVGVGVPGNWTPDSPPHVSVAHDGTPWTRHPVLQRASIRCTVRAASTTEAKRLAELARGLLLGHAGGDGITAVRSHLGVQPTRDDETKAELAWFAVGCTVRSQPI